MRFILESSCLRKYSTNSYVYSSHHASRNFSSHKFKKLFFWKIRKKLLVNRSSTHNQRLFCKINLSIVVSKRNYLLIESTSVIQPRTKDISKYMLSSTSLSNSFRYTQSVFFMEIFYSNSQKKGFQVFMFYVGKTLQLFIKILKIFSAMKENSLKLQ